MGSYVNKHLTKDEVVVYEASYHWIIFLSPAILTLFFVPIMLVAYKANYNWIIFLLSILILIFFIEQIIAMLTDEFVITNKRVFIRVGFISRKTLEMNLGKIESINVSQNILGRILGYGSVRVIGTGGTKEPFYRISKPLEFKKKCQELL